RGDAGEAMSQHGGVILRAIGAGLLLFAALALPPGRWALRFAWALPVGAVLALAALLYVRGGEGARALPAPFAPLAHGAIMATLALTTEQRPRETVGWAPGVPLASGDLVLVIDESIAAMYLDINHPLGVRSGLQAPMPALTIANFGVTAAAANCSAGSNLTLRFGGTRETYRTAFREKPSLWAYARRAGLRTVYPDGQRRGGALQNRMTRAERAESADFIQLGDPPVPQRHHQPARRQPPRALGAPQVTPAQGFPGEAAALGLGPARRAHDRVPRRGTTGRRAAHPQDPARTGGERRPHPARRHAGTAARSRTGPAA